MRPDRQQCVRIALIISVCLFAAMIFAQVPAPKNRVTQAVDNDNLVTRFGNIHPLARPQFDRGAASDAMPARRMLLLLQRAPEQQTALDKFVQEQHVRSSENYHKWLTPEEFGKMFGPSDADVAAVTNWLMSQGFQINKVGAGRTAIEFSGTAGQVRAAFHTALHKYFVNGEQHWANASDPQIPAALAPVMGGVVTLHNFQKKPQIRGVMAAQRTISAESGPNYTVTCSDNKACYALGPADFATIYNVQPLWSQGIDGTGQSIAIVGRTNINIQDVRDFRTLFGLPANDPEIVLNGPDPGIVNSGEQMEANLDVQWAGAIAKNAKVKLVISESTDVADGVDLSAFYIVDNNLAPVMSASFGVCEAATGQSYAQYISGLWEQAAAQGITVMISSGDNGAAGCDDPNSVTAASNGLGVNVLASTKFNVAVGGTDFDQNSSNFANYWSATNAPVTGQSALSYIPEIPWNESCVSTTGCSPSIWAASGGFSSFWDKPSWQTGTGVPNDGHRDIPDVSLFAASPSGHRSAYAVCQKDSSGSCASGSFYLVGGTSASSPAFASVMALVTQSRASSTSSGRQGNANYTLYSMAGQEDLSDCNSSTVTAGNSCAFYDTTKGNISVACVAGTPNCGSTHYLIDASQNLAWNATTGYDLATGLGSVNVKNLVTNWGTTNFSPTTTTITSLSPASLTHGQPANVVIQVSPASGTGTPTGDVSLIGSSTTGATFGIDGFALSGGTASWQTNLLPGGTYNVTAHYAGDGKFAGSDSAPIQVTVAKEASKTIAGVITYDYGTGQVSNLQASTAAYGSPYILEVNVGNSDMALNKLCYNSAAVLCPSGTLTITDNGAALDGGTFALNSFGYADDQMIQLTPGTHNIAAAYSGDSSFSGSTGNTSITITKAATTIGKASADNVIVTTGQTVNISVKISTQSSGAIPAGPVTFLDGGTPMTGNISYTGNDGTKASASLTAKISASFSSTGTHNVTASFNGGPYYAASGTSAAVAIQVCSSQGDFCFPPTPPPAVSVTAGAPAKSSITVNAVGGFSGTVHFQCDSSTLPAQTTCSFSQTDVPVANGGTGTTNLTINTTGSHQVASMRTVGWFSGVFAFALLGIVGQKRKARVVVLMAIATVLAIAAMTSCGGGSGGGSSTRTDPGTPAGTYSVGVVGTAQINGSTVTHTTYVSLTVN